MARKHKILLRLSREQNYLEIYFVTFDDNWSHAVVKVSEKNSLESAEIYLSYRLY